MPALCPDHASHPQRDGPTSTAITLQRRLSAILIADVVNYCKHMHHDEVGTHLQVRHIREQVVEPALARHRGRVVHRAGDGVLAEFDSAARALAAAVEIQRDQTERNQSLDAFDRVSLRIGISVGDVLVDRDDIAGCEVNLAARLQTVATPGGICISPAVRTLVHEDLGVRFREGRPRRLKNIGIVRVISVDFARVPNAKSRWRSVIHLLARMSWRKAPSASLPNRSLGTARL